MRSGYINQYRSHKADRSEYWSVLSSDHDHLPFLSIHPKLFLFNEDHIRNIHLISLQKVSEVFQGQIIGTASLERCFVGIIIPSRMDLECVENMGQTYSRLASVITDGVRSGKEQTMKHQIDIAPNNAIYIDGKRVVGQKPYGIFVTQKIDVSNSGQSI